VRLAWSLLLLGAPSARWHSQGLPTIALRVSLLRRHQPRQHLVPPHIQRASIHRRHQSWSWQPGTAPRPLTCCRDPQTEARHSSVALAFLNARSLAAQRADADQSLMPDLSLNSSKVISADVTVGPLTGVTASTVAETCGVSVADSTWVVSVCYSGAETFAECPDAHPALVSEIFALDRSGRYLDWLIQ
jgi:hypothetical protein